MHKVFLNHNISYKISCFMFSLRSQTRPHRVCVSPGSHSPRVEQRLFPLAAEGSPHSQCPSSSYDCMLSDSTVAPTSILFVLSGEQYFLYNKDNFQSSRKGIKRKNRFFVCLFHGCPNMHLRPLRLSAVCLLSRVYFHDLGENPDPEIQTALSI